jgi:hypothetical protein
MHVSASKSLMLLLAFTLVGCKRDDGGGGSITEDDAPAAYAALFCQLLESCDCSTPYASTDECIDVRQMATESSFAEAEAAGLIYEPECMAYYLSAYADIGCMTVTELLADPEYGAGAGSSCKVWSGTATAGEACISFYETVYADSCAQGLFCTGDVCTNLTNPDRKQLGETCDPQSEVCEEGTICSNSPDTPDVFVCEDLPGEGESCMESFICEEGFGCDTTDFICKGPVGPGEACDGFGIICQDGFYCDDVGQTCVPLLGEGDACTGNQECAEGLQCDPPPEGGAEVCTPEGPLVCLSVTNP